MCGISGFIDFSSNIDLLACRDSFIKNLSHRGPDGFGYYQDGAVCLVHNRLAIIDLSENGIQPLYNEDRSIAVICNGEIYNYQEIRAELLLSGHKFKSNSDCEVIAHLYEEYKGDLTKVLNRMTGMFALALYDVRNQKLLLARDRIGIKPLYYNYNTEAFSFASEILPLVKSGLVSAKLDQTSIYEYSNLGYIPEPNTIYEGIKALTPGTYLEISQGKISAEKTYWTLPQTIDYNHKRIEEVEESLDLLLKKIIEDHLIADVKVGSFLSAGIDSSLISYYSASIQNGIPTFTAAFKGEPEDESLIANQTAKLINSSPYNFNIEDDFFNGYENHFKNIDQPFGVSSALSLSRISQMAKPIVKVVLTGDGADEIFAGYDRHSLFVEPSQFKFLSKKNRSQLFKLAFLVSRKEKFNQAYLELIKPEFLKYAERITLRYGAFHSELISSEGLKDIDQGRYFRRFEKIWTSYKSNDQINQMLYTDVKTSLVDEMLFKSDRMTMHQGIEGRVPFLDHRLVEFAMSIPSDLKKIDASGKVPLRNLVSKYMGDHLGNRKKTGFNSPLKKMLNHDLKTQATYIEKLNSLYDHSLFDKKILGNQLQHIKSPSLIASEAYGLFALADFLKRN